MLRIFHPSRRSGLIIRRSILLAAAMILSGHAATATAAEMRTWSDATGQFKIRAKFLGSDQGKVTLGKEDGSEIDIDLNKLSAADQKYVAEQAGADARPS